MRSRTRKAVFAFDTTVQAMKMEHVCLERQLPGKLIAVPGEITAGCGMAWSVPGNVKDEVKEAAEKAGVTVQGIYDLMLY